MHTARPFIRRRKLFTVPSWTITRCRLHQYRFAILKSFVVLLVFMVGIICYYGNYTHHDIYNNILQPHKKISIINSDSGSFYYKINMLTQKSEVSLTRKRNLPYQKLYSARTLHYKRELSLSELKDNKPYKHPFSKLIRMENIKQNETNIFFIETTCSTGYILDRYEPYRGIHLNPRQCCAIESAALENKNHNIYILHTCPLNTKLYEQSPEYIKQTLAYQNVYILFPTLKEIFQGSPIEDFYYNNKIKSSLYPIEHMSDTLRLLVLWKFGGTYLDLDTITVRPLGELKYNFAGRTHGSIVSNAVLNFKHTGIGHDILTNILKELDTSFDGSKWAINGPHLITRMLLKECNFEIREQFATDSCGPFTIFSPEYFFSVPFLDYHVMFREMTSDEMAVKFNGSYIIHFWNRLSKELLIEVGSNQIYGLFASKYCPSVYYNCGRYF